MKFLLALAFLAVVCAIPHPGQNSAHNRRELEHWEPPQGAEEGNNQVDNTKGDPPHDQLKNSDESNENEDYDVDEDDSDKKINLDNLINVLSNIREALKKKIQDKLHNNKEDSEEDIYVPPNVPGVEDSEEDNDTATDVPQQYHGTHSEGPSSDHSDLPKNNSAVAPGNDTASDDKPKVNITQIRKEIHDKIENIISNILKPWLGNNSVEVEEGGNATATEPLQQVNNTEPPQNVSNTTRGNNTENVDASAPQGHEGAGNSTVTVAPQPSNNTSPAPNDVASNVTESQSASQSEVTIVNTSTTEAVQPQRSFHFRK